MVDVRCGNKKERVMVCHEGVNSLCLNTNAIADHLSHGDVLGNCGTPAVTSSSVSLKAMPNPFTSTTTLEFVMEEEGNYQLEVRNMDGVLVAVLAKGNSKAGEVHKVEFNRGSLPEGFYIGRIITDKETKFIRIMISR